MNFKATANNFKNESSSVLSRLTTKWKECTGEQHSAAVNGPNTKTKIDGDDSSSSSSDDDDSDDDDDDNAAGGHHFNNRYGAKGVVKPSAVN